MFKALLWIAEQIKERADAELFDPEPVRAELLLLHRRFELGEIGEAEFDKQEAELIERLERLEDLRRAT